MKKRNYGFLYLLILLFIFFLSGNKNNLYSGTADTSEIKAYFISADGEIAECIFRGDKLSISIQSPGKSPVIEIVPQVVSGSGAKYDNDAVMFWNKGDEAMIKFADNPEKKFVLADKYTGMISAGGGSVSEYYFSNAVNIIYVIKTDSTFVHGYWYLLKGDPLKSDPEYNTTLFELLESDNKSDFQCFLQEPGNPKKLILLQGKCDVNTPTEYFLTKEP